MNDFEKIANLIFPDAKPVSYWEEKYPERNLGEGAEVTRFAPSPTGYMHIGHFFGSNLDYRIARSTPNGVFIFRLEDTDSKREVEGSDVVALKTLAHYGVVPDEGFTVNRTNNGNYGPYRQSDRAQIYQSYAKKLLQEGKAFPCFCEKPEGKQAVLLNREQQLNEENQIAEKDSCRNLTYSQIEQNIKEGKPYCIRLKSNGEEGQKVKVFDVVRGEREMGANQKDVVLIKDDGIPPYAFAHAVDDHLMKTTTVVRGEDWISTWPQHVEIFNALGFKQPKYIHTPQLCKIGENGNKRKISKSKDPEADMRFYIQAGLPKEAVTEYLLNLLNSNFEEWREQNPTQDVNEFPFSVNKIGTSSPFFDLIKLEDVSKNVISKFTAEKVLEDTLSWAKNFDEDFVKEKNLNVCDDNFNAKQFVEFLENNKEFAINTFAIDRYTQKPRKDIAKWSEVPKYFNYMFRLFNPTTIADYEYNFEKITNQVATKFLTDYKKVCSSSHEKDEWFNVIKQVANNNGFATDNKLYKQNPETFVGNTADACALIRIAITGRTNSPDLYSICKVLGDTQVINKIDKFIEILNK